MLMNQPAWKRYVVITLCLVVGLGPIPSLAAGRAPAQQDYDGESMFRGLFFGQGEIGTLFPEIWHGTRFETIAFSEKGEDLALRMREDLVHLIHRADTSFFDRFGEAIGTGSHLKISDALDEAGKMLVAALSEQLGVDVRNLVKKDDGQDLLIATFIAAVGAVAIYAAVAVNSFGAYNVVAVYDTAYFWGGEQDLSSVSQFGTGVLRRPDRSTAGKLEPMDNRAGR